MKLETTGIAVIASSLRLVVGCLTALACTIVVGDSAWGATTLRWRLKPGEVVHYTMTQKTTNAFKPKEGAEASASMSQAVDLHWTVKSVSPEGGAEMIQTIDRVRVRMEAAGQASAFEFDSDAKQAPQDGLIADQLVPLLKALVGAEFTFKMNVRGEMSDVKIPEKLMEMVRQANPGGGNSAFTDEGLKNLVVQLGLAFPEAALDQGKTWTQQSKIPLAMLGSLIMDKTYALQGPDEADAARVKIDLNTKVTIQPAPEAGISMKIVKEDGKGAVLFDLERGRIVSSRVEDLLVMSLSTMGQEIEQTTKTVTEMKLSSATSPK
jgi:Family of unknown function (DUF6263)